MPKEKSQSTMCSCCRDQPRADPKREVLCGTYDGESGHSMGIFAPLCEECFQAHQAVQAAHVAGEISKYEYRLYKNALSRAVAHGLLVGTFVRNPKLQDAMVRLRVLDY
jgi:hypothetical protein